MWGFIGVSSFVGARGTRNGVRRSARQCRSSKVLVRAHARARARASAGAGSGAALAIPTRTRGWVPLLSASDIAPGETKAVLKMGQSILVTCDTNGQVYASSNMCPHLGAPLANGMVSDGVITCALHKSSWNLSTGEPTGQWCPFPPLVGPLLGKLRRPAQLSVFPVRESNDGKYIEALLNVNAVDYYEKLLNVKSTTTGASN